MGPPTAPRMEVSRTMVADHFGEGDGPHWRQHSETPAAPSQRPRAVSGGDNSQSIREETCRYSRTLSRAYSGFPEALRTDNSNVRPRFALPQDTRGKC